MGNKKSKKPPTIYDKIESLLVQTYKNTGIDFSENELVNFKLRILDSEKYFSSNFDYFIFFNNFLFKEQLAVLYDNFNQIIEKANKNPEKPLKILIDFDDETEYIMQGSKLEFDSLFTIIFEKLEIPTLIFFDMTNTDSKYVSDFFTQVIESVELYKYNRKFDCMYFLFPNTDYFLKNENTLIYLSNKPLKSKVNLYSDSNIEVINEYTDAIFLNKEIEKFINSTYPKNISNLKFEQFIKEIKPTHSKILISFDLNCNFENLESTNSENFEKIKFLMNMSESNSLIIFFNINLDTNNIEFFENTILKNMDFVLKKIIFLFTTCLINESVLGIKFNLKIKNEDEIAELNKLSSRTYNLNNINFYNNFASNSHRDIKSAREIKSKRERDKIFNYFYDSQIKNVFEILTFELTTIINKFLDFPQLHSKNINEDKENDQQLNNIIQDIQNYCSNNNGYVNYNSNNNFNNKDVKIDKNDKNNNLKEKSDKFKLTNQDQNRKIAPNSKQSNKNINGPMKNKKNEKITRKLNIEFNEISQVYKEIQEIVKYSTDPNFEGSNPKIIKLDHNLHSEKLFLFWEKPLGITDKHFKILKERNREYCNLKNIINNFYKMNKLKEWNILLNLQNMFLDDNIRKTYKIEKSNINLQEYLQKIH